MKEIIEQRTLRSKTFDLGNNEYQLVSRLNPIHYKKEDGVLDDIDMAIENGKVSKCSYNIELLDKKVGYKGIDPKGKKIELELENVTFKEPVIEENIATYVEVKPDVDFVLEFLPTRITAKVVLKSDSADKTSVYRSLREEGAKGKLLNLGVDSKGRNTKLNVTEEELGTDEKRITQVFEGKVMKMNKTTRKREWSDDVTYPVVIDPTSTFTVSVDVQGMKNNYFGTTSTSVYDKSQYNGIWWFYTGTTNYQRYGSAFLFDVSGIRQYMTITSATLKLYVANASAYSVGVEIKMDSNESPGLPSYGPSITSPGTATGTFTGYTTAVSNSLGNKASYNLNSFTVTSAVQTMVNNFDYFDASQMLFYGNAINSNTTTRYIKAAAYAKNWGTAKDPELVINFTGPASKTHWDLSTDTAA